VQKNPWSEGVYTATFKKLKILSTSQQLQGILFRLKFTLKKYAGSNFTAITTPNCDVVSHPVEVFSHSQYLNKKAPKRTSGPTTAPRFAVVLTPNLCSLPAASAASTNTRKEFKDIVKKMDGKKVQGALFSVLQAFKEQGGSRSSVLDVVQQVYGSDDAGSDEGSKARGPSRRMSAPSSYNGPQISQPQLILTPSLPLVTATTSVADANIAASAVEAQFLNELLSKFQLGAISFDDFVNHLAQGVGKARAIQLLAQMGLNVGLDATTTTASSSPSPLGFPTTSILPSFPSNNPLDSSNSLAAILNALAHQQTQLAQLQAAQQSQQLSSINPFLQQHQQQQQQLQLQHQQYQQQKAQAQLHQQLAAAASSVPVVPKPRRLSSSQAAAMSPTSTSSPSASTSSGSSPLHSAGMTLLPSISLPSSATVTPSSASSSLSTLADAISSHLHMQPQPQPQTTSTPSSTSSSSLLMHHMNSFSSASSSSNDSNSVVLPPIAATLAAVSSSSSSNSTGPLPSLFSLCSLASAIDSPATTASAAIDQDRGRKRSFEAAAAVAPPSPIKIARRDGDVASSPSSSAARCEDSKQTATTTQWYWKNNSTWEPYAEGVSSQLERAHSNAKATPCIVVLHDVPYRMDFQSMTQQRIDNPKRWKHIRRGEEDEHSA
jgi:hypothetical protein